MQANNLFVGLSILRFLLPAISLAIPGPRRVVLGNTMEHGRDKDTVSSCHESNTGNSLCEHCMNIFMQKAVHQTLAKWAGLEYRRRFIDMLRSALNGCPLCRELLCMPYNYKPEDHRMNGRGHSFYDRPISWPWVSWASAVDMHESRKASTAYSRLLGGFTNPELRFLLKGDVQRHHYIDVTRHQRLRFREKLTFEVSAQTGTVAPYTYAQLSVLIS